MQTVNVRRSAIFSIFFFRRLIFLRIAYFAKVKIEVVVQPKISPWTTSAIWTNEFFPINEVFSFLQLSNVMANLKKRTTVEKHLLLFFQRCH
jgi:hypothetical protein